MLKQTRRKANKNITRDKSLIEFTKAPIIFLNPGNFETDLSGLSTRKLLRADKLELGSIGTTEMILKKKRISSGIHI
jgi:hypothetical protein